MPTFEVDLAQEPSHYFVEHYPGLVYRQYDDHGLFPGGRTLHFDLLKPVADGATPLVIFVKGGAFKNVHRARYLPALTSLAEQGVAIASVEYRTSNEARFPAQVDDVRHAIRYLRQHARRLDIDPRAIAVWGNSAGSTIATIVGASAPTEDDRVCAVASWYGIHDPAQSPAYRAPDSAIRAALGSPGGEGPRWFQPSDHINSGSAPTFLLHGTEDTIVDVEQSRALARSLTQHGVEHELMIVRGGTHSFSQMCTRTDALKRTNTFLRHHLAAARHGTTTTPLQRRRARWTTC